MDNKKRTLKIVAKYADACNLFRSTDTVKRKLNILKEHCKSVGKDYDSILKTKLGLVVIENDKQTVEKKSSFEKKVNYFIKGMPEEQNGEDILSGDVNNDIKA